MGNESLTVLFHLYTILSVSEQASLLVFLYTFKGILMDKEALTESYMIGSER